MPVQGRGTARAMMILAGFSVWVLALSGCTKGEVPAASGALVPSVSSSVLAATGALEVSGATGVTLSSARPVDTGAQMAALDLAYLSGGTLPQSGGTSTGATVRIPIFMYHYVEVVQDPRDKLRQGLALTPAALEKQLQYFSEQGVRTYFVRNIPSMLSGSLLSDKRVLLTFDDGYEDFYENAFPLLKKYGVKATLYMIVDRIGKKDYMTQEQLQEIAHSGLVEIGSHTITHPDLRALSLEKQRQEIVDSKRQLEDRLGIVVRTFAYPYGFYTDDTVGLVEEAGYTAAVTTHSGRQQTPSLLFTLLRLRPGATTSAAGLTSLLGN